MTGCRDYGDLIGPYVLGALEPGEVEEMTQHLAECDRCALERRRLAGLPALLDAAQADDTIAALSPQLEDAVLDQFVKERARSARPRRRWPRFAIPAAAAATVILAVVLALVLPGGGDSAYARAELWSMSGQVLGNASVAEVDGGTRVRCARTTSPSVTARSTSSGACAPTAAGSTAEASTRAATAPPPLSSPRRSGRASTTWS